MMFRDSSEKNHQAHLFDAEALGASFRELAVDVVQGEKTEFVSRWYRASHAEADLMIWSDGDKRIIKHQLAFFGQVVEWSPIHGTRTGLIIETEIDGVTAAGPDEVAEIIRFDLRAQKEAVAQGIRILTTIASLSDEMRAHIIYNLRESPKLHKNARERALKAWAPEVEDLVSDRRPGFWKRLKTWMVGT